MTPEERDRLTRLEVQLNGMDEKLDHIQSDVDEMKIKWAKAGGITLALTGIGAAIGWLLTQISKLGGLFS